MMGSSIGSNEMNALLHLGLDHPNFVWIAVTAVLAFAAGLGVATLRVFTGEETTAETKSADELR
ncbi:hypothetical protein C450_14272 [Halococcus salifodinae DSM 8989]|uniref:Uncharacterized protein n=2 Tax=Halococcus salifodinae TaxID=36738 RepID=M0N2A7_9EURY|nr:hypothetical protein C450_14272 [Halococcus salifodinae DSM 8989]